MAVGSLKLLGGGAVRGSEGHPADDDDLASEKGHLLAKRALFVSPPPPLGTALKSDRFVVSGDLSQGWQSQRRGEYERGTPLIGGQESFVQIWLQILHFNAL